MPDSVYLVGAESVERASHAMSSAADRMQSAASSIYESVDRLLRGLDEFVTRIERAVAEVEPPTVAMVNVHADAAHTSKCACLGDFGVGYCTPCASAGCPASGMTCLLTGLSVEVPF